MGRKPYNAHLEIRTCHDIRKLTPCEHCSGIGDKRHMILLGGKHLHGRCFIALYGLSEFLSLDHKYTDRLYLSDIGVDAARALTNRRDD